MDHDMSPAEAAQRLADLRNRTGERADVHATIVVRSPWLSPREPSPPPLQVTIYPAGYNLGNEVKVKASTLREMVEGIEAATIERMEEIDARIVRAMALAIIEIRAANGEVTEAALRMRWGQDVIDRLGQRACADADEIASNGPFEIIFDAAPANAPSDGDVE